MKYKSYMLFLSIPVALGIILTFFIIGSFFYSPEYSDAAVQTLPSCVLASNRNLKMGIYSISVLEMQKVLNLDPVTQVSTTGLGSPGQEALYFGIKTKNAVMKFQEKYAADILAPYGLTHGSGNVGVDTRNKIRQVCLAYVASMSTSTIQSADVSVSTIPPVQTALTSTARNAYKYTQKYFRGGGGGGMPSPTPTPSISPTPKPSVTPTPTPSVSPTPTPTPSVSPTPTPTPPVSTNTLQWGAYTGDTPADLATFEALVGKQVNIQSIFVAFTDAFPTEYTATVGAKGKTLLIFWEPTTGYDQINNGSQDVAIMNFVLAAKTYKYPIILAPFHEMNLNEGAWGYSVNGNTAAKFKTAWIHLHDLFIGATNVKFALAFNNDSVPNVAGNKITDYYPGDAYVDYVGIDGFNFGNPWQSFNSVFDISMATVAAYNKPVYIFSLASAAGSQKASWVLDGLGTKVKTYKNIAGWVWFNVNKEQDWRVNSDQATLDAFKAVIK